MPQNYMIYYFFIKTKGLFSVRFNLLKQKQMNAKYIHHNLENYLILENMQ